jgi:hypothetical protein
MGCLNWRELRAKGGAEQKNRDLIPVLACNRLIRKRYPVWPPIPPVLVKPFSKKGTLEGIRDPHV